MGTEALVGQILQMQNQNRQGAQDWLNKYAQGMRMDALGRRFMQSYSFTPDGLEKFARDEKLSQQQLMEFVQTMKQFEDYKKQRLGTQQAQQDLTQGAERFGMEKERFGMEKADQAYKEGSRIPADQARMFAISGKEAGIDRDRAAAEQSRASAGYQGAMADMVRRGGKESTTAADLKMQESERQRKLGAMANILDSIAGEKGSVSFSPDYGFDGIMPESKIQEAQKVADQNGYTLTAKPTGDKEGGFIGIGGEPMYKISISEKGLLTDGQKQSDIPTVEEMGGLMSGHGPKPAGESAIEKLSEMLSDKGQQKETPKKGKREVGKPFVDEKTKNVYVMVGDENGRQSLKLIKRRPIFKYKYSNIPGTRKQEKYINPAYQEYLDLVEKYK